MKNSEVDPLKNIFIFFKAIQGHQESVIDITLAVGPDILNTALRFKLVGGDGDKLIQSDPDG